MADAPTKRRPDRIVFPCGAAYQCDADDWRDKVKRGRIRLAVLDTDNPGNPKRPTIGGAEAHCRFACPTRKYRRATRAMSERDGVESFGTRVVVVCSGVLDEVPRG